MPGREIAEYKVYCEMLPFPISHDSLASGGAAWAGVYDGSLVDTRSGSEAKESPRSLTPAGCRGSSKRKGRALEGSAFEKMLIEGLFHTQQYAVPTRNRSPV